MLTKKQIRHREFLKTDVWQEIRQNLFKLRGYKCEKCGKRIRLHVHHLSYKRFGGKEIPEDLQILCTKHHYLTHHPKKKKTKKEYPYKNLLKIYPEIISKNIPDYQKAIELQKVFKTGKKLKFKDGRIRRKRCLKYLRKIDKIYRHHAQRANWFPGINFNENIKDDKPCWHYID